jgi:enoyl-CoA hydratase
MTMTLNMTDDIAVIAMDDGKANAVSHAFLDTISPLLDTAEADAKAVVIAGRPGRFSGGFDLKVMQGATREEVAALVDRGGDLALRLMSFPKPVVIACTGHALAMGAMLLMSADVRVGVSGDFKIGLNESAIGMVLPHFGITLPRARLNPAYFTRAVVNAELFDPETAVDVGFLDYVATPDALMDAAMAQAKTLGALPQKAFAGNKKLIRAAAIEAMTAKTPLL